MANGGKGAVGKIYIETAVVDNFKQIASQIKSGLGNGLKDLKDLELPFNFREKDFAQAVSTELQEVTRLLGTSKLSKLDYSGIIPTLTDALADDSLTDSIKYQIVQGFRQGLETANEMLTSSNLTAIQQKTGHSADKTLAAIGGYSAINDIISSFGLNKTDSKLLAKNYNKAAGWVINGDAQEAKKKARQQTAQLMALKDVQDKGYGDVLRYLVDTKSSASQLTEPRLKKLAEKEELTKHDAEKVAGILERITYLTEHGKLDSQMEAQDTLTSLQRSKALSTILQRIKENPKLTRAATGIRESVRAASEFKDAAYERRNDDMFMDGRHPMTILTEFAEQISGVESVYNKIAPLLAKDIPETSPFPVQKMFDETIRSMKVNQELEAKKILEAESSASRAEDTLEKTKEVVETAKQSIGDSQIDDKTKKTNSVSDTTQKIAEEAVPEEKPESSIKTWKDLEKAEREYDKLRDKIVSTYQEVETLFKQLEEARQRADESRIRYKNLEGQQTTKEKEVNSLSERKKDASERLERNKEELKEVEKELREIQNKRKELKGELKKYEEETKALYGNEAIQNKEANIQRQKEIGEERVDLSAKISNLRDKQLPTLEKRLSPEIKAKGQDSALEAFKERAEKMQKDNATYEKVLADYEAGKAKKEEYLLAKTRRIFSRVDFLKALQNAKDQGVKGEDLSPFMEDAKEKYGFDLKLFKKDKDFRKDADKTIQKELDEAQTPIKKQIEKNKVKLQTLEERNKKLAEEAQSLDAKIREANRVTKERETGRAKIQKEIDALDKEENSKITTKNRLTDSVQKGEELLNQPRYASLEEAKKEMAEGREAVEKAKKEAQQAQKDFESIQKMHRKKKNELVDMSNSRRSMEQDIEIGQTNLLTEEIETRTAPDASKTKSRKKEVLEKRREDLADKRKQLEEEIKRDNEALAISETKQNELNRSIEQITSEQETNQQKQAESRSNLQTYNDVIKESEKKLNEAKTKLATLREKQEQLTHEKEEFDAETERLMSQKAFKKNTKISNEIHGIENDIQQRKDNLAILTQDAEQMSKALKATPEKRPLALDELKDAARANQKAQDELREIEILLDQGEFKSPEEEQNLRARHKIAKEKGTKAYAAYINAIENATESKTPYNFLEEYAGKKYDPAQMISPENYFMYQQFGTFVLDKSLLEPFKELQNLLDERNKQIEQAQKEIDIQESKIGELQKKLSKGWQDVNPEERAQQSAKKQAKIDEITAQKQKLEEQQSDAQSNLEIASNLSKSERSTLDNLETEGTNLESELTKLKEKETKEVESYTQLTEIRDEKLRRLERIRANEDLLKQAEEEISNCLQNKSKGKPPVQEQKESTEDNPIVKQADEEIKEVEEVTQSVEERKKELEGKIQKLNSLIESFPSEEDYRKFYDTDSIKTYNEPASTAKNPTSAAMKQLRERGNAFKQTVKDIKAQEKEMKSMDKESVEYKKAEENLQRLQDQYARDWVAMYYAHEELRGWGVDANFGSKKEQQTYNKWVPEEQGDKEHPFSEENLKMMLERIQEQRKRKKELEAELAKYQEELKSLTEEKSQKETPVKSTTPEPAPTTESASGQPEAIAEETEGITTESDAIVEELQREEEALNEGAEKIKEEREKVKQAKENYKESVNNTEQGKTQSSTPVTVSQPNATPQEKGEQAKPEVKVAKEEAGEVQKSREDLEKERTKLLEEIQKSKDEQAKAEEWLKQNKGIIQDEEKTQNALNNSIDQNTSRKKTLEQEASNLTNQIDSLTKQLEQIREKRHALEIELQNFNRETNEITSGEEYVKKLHASGSLTAVKGFIQDLQQEYSEVNQAQIEMNRLKEVPKQVKGKTPAYQYLKEMAEANKAAQAEYAKLVKGEIAAPNIEDFEDISKFKEADREYDRLQQEIRDNLTKANYNYVRAVQNAMREKVAPSKINRYLGKEYDINNEFPDSFSKTTDFDSILKDWDDNDYVSITELQSDIEEKSKVLVNLQKEIEKQQEEARRLKEILGADWETNNWEARTKQAEKKEAEIDALKRQETDLEGQKYYKEGRLRETESETKSLDQQLKQDNAAKRVNEDYLRKLEEGRKAREAIIKKAKQEQEEKARELKELDQLIAETEARESTPPSTPTTDKSGGGNDTVPSSEQSGEESPVVQNANQQLENLKNEEQQLKDKLAQITDEKQNIEKTITDIDYVLNKDVSVKTQKEAYDKAQFALIKASTASAERFGDYVPEDKNSNEWKEWFERNKETIQQEKLAWLEYYKAMEEFESHGGETASKIANRRRLQPSDAVKRTRQDWGFTSLEDLKQQLEADLQAKKEILSSYEQQEKDIQSQIINVQQKQEQLKSSQSPLSTSGTQTADGVRQEGNEATDAASKMKALADAKREALEANRQLAESADTTNNALKGESESALSADFNTLFLALTEIHELLSQFPAIFAEFGKGFDTGQIGQIQQIADVITQALNVNQQLAESATNTKEAIQNEGNAGDFNTLILALTEIYELLSQIPQLFANFKGVDLTGVTEPLNLLSETIKQLPKEGLNISLGDSFDNLAGRIDEVLQKIQELTSQTKTAEIESNIAEKYDGQIKQLNEQINQLKTDADEAKKALEELKKTQQDVGQTTSTKKEKKQIDPLSQIDKQLAKEYDNLHNAQDKLFTTTNVSEYNSALENVENTLQRIRQLEQDIVSQYAGQSQTDYLLMGYGDDPIDTLSNRLPESTKARNEAQSSTRQLAKEYIEQQKAEIETLVDSLKTINIVPEDTQSNWGKKRREEYAQITEGAQAASQAIDTLNASLESMETSGANPTILKNFLELKESTAQMVKDVQDKNNVFGNDIQAASTKLIERLSNVEERLQIIKRDSGKLINIDPALAGALATIEKHLNKIHDLKSTISKDPLQAINPQFTTSANSYLAQMEGKGKSKSIVEGLEQTSARSQTDFKRMTTNYNSYATALKKLFDDISKGASVSLAQLEEDLSRVNELATKLANSTGLERNNLLTGELNPKADPQIADTQAKAANKVAIAYESMYTSIESRAKAAQSTIESIFGTEGISQGLDTRFVEGNVKGFGDFVQNANQAGEALNRLKEIQDAIRTDNSWIAQEENVKEYQQTIDILAKSLEQVAKNAPQFSVANELDVQKLRASTSQFIRDNPALSGVDIAKLEGYIDQLQGKINNVDFTNVKNGIESVKQEAIEAGRTGDTFFSMLTQRFKSLGAYLLSFVSFYRVIGVFKDGLNIIKELDSALTEMNKVSTESLSSLQAYQHESFDVANEVGTTAVQLQQSTADFIRLGETFEQAKESARVANELLTVSEFNNIQDATTALVSISAAYEDVANGLDKQAIIDKLNKIGDEYAISTDGLATALQDSASALTTANNDMDEAAALIAAGNTVTQDASKTGKAMRTVALRLVGTKEAADELQEMGEDTSDMIMSQSKMREMIMNATKVASNNYKGVDIQDEIGRYKSTFQILNEIGSIWDEIKQADLKTGDNRQNLLLEAMAGKNRANTLASVLMNNDVLVSAYNDSKYNAAGKATEELEKVSQGIEFHLTRLKNAWQEMWASAANRDAINGIIDLATAILKVVDNVGLLGTAFTVVYGGIMVKGLTTANSWLVKFVRALDNAKVAGQGFGDTLHSVFTNIGAIKSDNTHLKGLAQIQKERADRANVSTVQNTSETASDVAVAGAKGVKTQATIASTQATRDEVAAQAQLATSDVEVVAGETAETASKAESTAAAQQAAQANLEEAETAKIATAALKEKAQAEVESYIAGESKGLSRKKKKALKGSKANLIEEDIKFLEDISPEADMEWSTMYIGGLDNIGEKAAEVSDDIGGISEPIGDAVQQTGLLATTAGEVSQGFSGIGAMLAGLAVNPMTWLIGIPAAISLINIGFSMWKKHQQDIIDQGKDAANTWNKTGETLSDYEQQLRDLNIQLQNPNLSGQEELEIKEKVFDIQQKITEEYGKAAEGIDLTNGNLNQQLDTLRKIRKEQAKENYKDSGGSYDEAIKKMEGTAGGGILNNGYHLQLELDYGHEDQFKKIMEEAEKAGFSVRKSEDGTLALFDIKANAEDAEAALDSLSESLLDVQTEMGKKWEGSYFEDFSKSVFKTIKQNDNFLTKYRDTYYAALETKLFNENDEGADLYFRYGEGVENYNTALLSGDKKKIEEARQAWESLTLEKENYVNSKIATGGQDYSRLFGNYEKDLNQSAISTYNMQEKMGTKESKTLIEQAFGTYKENKRVSKENQKAVIEASKAVLKEWKKANKEGKKIDLGSEAVQNLAKAAHEAEIPFSTITNFLQNGTTTGLQEVLDGTRISAEDLEAAFYDTGSAINSLGSNFGITFESPKADIDAFINTLAEMVGVTSESTLQSGDALSHFFSETSAKIDKVNALSSIVQHGLSQTGLTYTKTMDDQGHEIASEVKTIIDAYKNLEGFDIGSLFEETSTGIQLNMDAYRALAAEEEAETERMYKLNRARLQNQLETAPTDERKDAIQRQIQELDLLQTAYEGATSAFAKYINQQNAGDYQDNYETIRDNAVKRGNELLQKGYVGTEEFRSIAQLFSNESLANADVDTVMKAYQNGLANVQKYLTEDARVGMQTFLDDLMNMPYEFGTYFNSDMLAQMSEEEKQMIMDQTGLTEEALGKIDGYYLQFTEAQEQQLADHLGVSTDMLESFFNMLNALGFDIHFYKDGTDTDFTKLNEDIESSRKSLLNLKEVANDPNLVSKLDFSVEELDTADELKQKITDLEQLKTELPMGTDAYEEANRLIDELREKLGLIEAHEVTPNIKLEDYSKVEETMENIQGTFDKAKEIDFNFNEGSSAELEQAANLLSTLPEEVVTNYGFEYTDGDPKAMYDQLVELYNLGNGDLEVGLKVKKEGLDEAKQEADDLNNTEATMNVDAELTGDKPLILQWLEGLSALFTVNAEASEVEKVKQEAEKPVQIPAHLVAENSEEDVVTQANEGSVIAYSVEVDTTGAESSLETMRQSAEQPIQVPVTIVAQNSEEEIIPQDETAGTTITYMVNVDTSEAESALETIHESAEQPIETPLTLKAQNTVQDAVNQAGGNQPAVVNQQTTTTETVNHVENYTANTSGLEEARNALTSLQSKSGSTVTVNVGVSGAEKITQTQTKLNQLLQKAKSKINVVVNGNHSGFLKSYNETISKLNEIARKDTTAKIKGDNSNLKDKVSEAKSKLNSIDDKKVHITASATGFDTITSWKTGTYDKLSNKTITITTHYKTTGTKPSGGNGYQGSAHNQGTIMSNGHAYAGGTLSGDWGLPKAEKGALINELGSEIVVSPDGHWQILNSGDPTFANLPKGAIIFNHKQTESLLKKGYVNGSHGKIVGGAFASGTVDDDNLEGEAFVTGTTKWNGNILGKAYPGGSGSGSIVQPSSGGSGGSGSGSGGGGNHSGGNHSGGNHSNNNNNNKSSKDFLQTLDAIEIQLQRVDAELQRLETNANKTFESFTSRAKSFNSEIHTTKIELAKIEKSLDKNNKRTSGDGGNPANYFRKADAAAKAAGYKSGEEGANKTKYNMTGQALPNKWIKRIRNGVASGSFLTLNDVGDEGLWKKIQAYQTWYEKGIKLQQKRQEYLNKLNQLTIAHLQLTQKSYETEIAYTNEQMNTNQQILEKQSALEKNATLTYLNNNITYDTNKKAKYKSEKTTLQNELDRAVKNGYIKKNSEEWYTWMSNIQKLETQIVATENDIIAQTNKKLEYIQEKWQSALDMLDKTAEEYDIRIKRQNSKQLISRTYTAGKNKGKYTPTKADYDNVIKLYDLLNKNEEKRRENLQKERNELQNQLDQAKKDKRFEKGSQEYQKWLGEIKDLDNQILEVENNIVENIVNKLEYIQDKWDAILDHFSTTSDRFKEFADLQSAQGYEVSRKYYQKQIQQINPQIKAMQQEASDLQDQLNEAVKSGNIVTYSSEWYEWATNIEDIRNDIVGLQKDIVDLNNDIRQLGWDRFDEAQDTIKGVIEEMEFLSDLIRDDDLFDDKGMPTEKAQASAALIAQQYDLLMEQANRYAHKVAQLNKQLANDPYNKTLIKQRNEWLESQQDSIKAAQQQKEAMVDLAEKGIKKQIEAMNELISKYEEALDKQRSQEQYAKSIADKQKSISNLEKQLRSMGGDDSEEGKARRQQLRDQLKQAQQDLKDTQEDKRISDIKEALKEMQDKYEEVLNDRLKNIDALFKEAIDRINQNGTSIVDTIKSIGDSVNYTFSAELAKTYEGTKNTNKNDSSALVSNTKSNGTFVNNAATTLSTVAKIVKDTEKAMAASDITANNKIKSATTTTVKPTTTTKKKSTATTKKSTTTKKKTTATTKKTTTTKKKTTTTKKNSSTGSSKRENGKNAPAEFSKNPGKFNMSYKSKTTTTKKPTSGLTLINKPNTKNGSTAPLKNSNPASLTKAPTKAFTATTKKATTTTKKATTTTKKATTTTKRTTTTTKRTTTTAAKPKNGTYTENGKKVYYYNGVKKTGLFYGTDGRKRLVDGATGTLVKGWRTIGGVSTYYFDSSGRAVTGLHTINGAQYYFNEIAILKKGTFTVGNTTYTTDKNGKILSKKSATTGHLAKGTANVKRSGMYEVDEHGGEVFINKNGKIYTRLDKGSTVLPHDAAINLLKGMSDPLGFITSHMDLHPNNTTTNNNTGDTTNYITFNIPNVTNYSEFMREAQRDPNFTKYIQEISLGKLNGNNSLKGNSIRFR